MRTRNFRVRTDVVQRGSVTESQKGKKAYVERRVTVFSVESTWQRPKGRPSSPPHRIRRQRLTKRDRKIRNSKALQTKGAKFHAGTGFVKTRHVKLGILPCVKTTSLKTDENMARNAISDLLRPRKSPARSQRKVVQKDQLRHRSLHNWVVYLKILIRETLFNVNLENRELNTPSNSPKAPGT